MLEAVHPVSGVDVDIALDGPAGRRVDIFKEWYVQVRRPSTGYEGGAGALVFTSPSQEDWALVILGGLADRGLPYRVTLQDPYGRYAGVGVIRKLSSDGSARTFRTFQRNLSGFTYVLVKDRAGKIVLSGDLGGSSVRVPG